MTGWVRMEYSFSSTVISNWEGEGEGEERSQRKGEKAEIGREESNKDWRMER